MTLGTDINPQGVGLSDSHLSCSRGHTSLLKDKGGQGCHLGNRLRTAIALISSRFVRTSVFSPSAACTPLSDYKVDPNAHQPQTLKDSGCKGASVSWNHDSQVLSFPRGSSDSAADSSLLLTHEKFGSSRLPDNETTSDSDDDDTSLDSAEMGYPPASLVKLGFWIAQGGSRVTWSDFTLEASAGGGLLIDTDHSKPPLTPLNLVVDGQMTMENMIIYVDFDEFDWSNDALCGELTEDTSLKIASSPPAIHVAFLQSGNITYINTIFLPMQEPDELPHCKFSGSFDAPKGTHADVEAPLFSPGDVLFKILDRGRLTLRRIKSVPPWDVDVHSLDLFI
eukprot:gene22599-29739_t